MFEIWGIKFDPLYTYVIGPLVVSVLVLFRNALRQGLTYVLRGVAYRVAPILTREATARLTIRRYARLQLEGATSIVYVPSPSAKDISLPIDSIFVPLVLETSTGQAAYDHWTAVNAGNRVRIIGDPGSGKSSVIKKIFRDACKNAIRQPRFRRLPMLLELRHLSIPNEVTHAALGSWLLDYLVQTVSFNKAYDLKGCIDSYAQTSGLLILLDGLDEVSTSNFERVRDAINGLSRRLFEIGENNILILTMRTQFHLQVRESFGETFPTLLSLKPFSPSDIFDFLTRWPLTSEDNSAEVVRIYNDLTDRPTLREMCTNPLVLSMYVARDQHGPTGFTPDSRTDFYSRVVDELVIKRRVRQLGRPAQALTVLREQRLKILGRLAFDHLADSDQPANLLDWADAVNIVRGVLKNDEPSAEQYLRELSRETGIISEEREGESLRFIHLTFCEFLAGLEAAQGRKNGWVQLLDKHRAFQSASATRTRLLEVIPFACVLVPRHMREEAIVSVSILADEHLLASVFLETKAYTSDLFDTFVRQYRAKLLDVPTAQWTDEWLRELHLFLVVISDSERSVRGESAITASATIAQFFKEISERSDTAIGSLIDAYAEQDAAAAFRVAELCDLDVLTRLPDVIIKNCDQPPFLAVALERAEHELHRWPKWAALFAEAGLRSYVIAFALSRLPAPMSLNDAAHRFNSSRWFTGRALPYSFYTHVISCAIEDADPVTTPVLWALKTLPPPGKALVTRVTMFLGAKYELISVFLLVMSALLSASYFLFSTSRQALPFWLPLAILIGGFILFAFSRRCAVKYRSYLEILNVRRYYYQVWLPLFVVWRLARFFLRTLAEPTYDAAEHAVRGAEARLLLLSKFQRDCDSYFDRHYEASSRRF